MGPSRRLEYIPIPKTPYERTATGHVTSPHNDLKRYERWYDAWYDDAGDTGGGARATPITVSTTVLCVGSLLPFRPIIRVRVSTQLLDHR